LESETSALHIEASSLRTAAQTYRTQKTAVDAENAANRQKLSELLNAVYNLQARVDFKEGEVSDLKIFLSRLQEVLDNLKSLGQKQEQSAQGLKQAWALHQRWMNRFNVTTASYAPHFKDLNTPNSVKKAAYILLGFEDAAPARSARRGRDSTEARFKPARQPHSRPAT
jgi:hypothetical protein